MRRIGLLLFMGLMMFSCKTNKAIVTKKTNKQTEVVAVSEEKAKPNSVNVYASPVEAYIATYGKIAQDEMQLYGVPASITLAQGILESGSGKGRLSVDANNHFGIKCHGWKGEKIYHDDDKAQECFRKYDDAKYSFRDHSLFLKDRKRYSKLFMLKKEDYVGWSKGLRAAGYATDTKYPQKLISLIERYRLYDFDKEVLGNSYTKYKAPISANTRNEYTVLKGDTLYSISRKYGITVKELQEINRLSNTALSVGQKLIIKP